jgi:hypothetical protein
MTIGQGVRKQVEIALDGVKKGASLRYVVAAVELPTNAVELITNTEQLESKLQYYWDAYDDEMRLKTNDAISIIGMLIV